MRVTSRIFLPPVLAALAVLSAAVGAVDVVVPGAGGGDAAAVDVVAGSSQSAFPYYYQAGLPSEADLVRLDDPPADAGPPALQPRAAATDAAPAAFPEVYADALARQRREVVETEVNRARAALTLGQSYCEAGAFDKATEIFRSMPEFGDNLRVNAHRADAAGALILGWGRSGDPDRAREVYDALPRRLPGKDAQLARARAILNLTTFYVLADRFADAYTIVMDIGDLDSRREVAAELFTLLTRMIPYLDNALETDKARTIYNLLLRQVDSPETAALLAENLPSLTRYFFQTARITDSPVRRGMQLQFLGWIFDSLDPLAVYPEVARLRTALAADLVDAHTEDGDTDRARQYYEVIRRAEETPAPAE
ncbi:MAG: hypothetical protein LIP77_04965 [Planctomycetes bacterium]|nr:hypothetical protein [Planctomycetota bacterium]